MSAFLLATWGCGDAAIRGDLESGSGQDASTQTSDGGGQGGGDDDDTGQGGDKPVVRAYAFATMGRRCVGGASETWLVLSKTRQDCAAHASALDSERPGTLKAQVPEGSMSARVTAQACPEQGRCSETEVQLAFESIEAGTSARGRWTLTEASGETFEATWCDAEDYAPPGDVLVRDLSIREISLNQGVDVPLAREGNAVTPLKAPLIAGRGGLLRVFVQPSATWRPRTVIARLEVEGRSEAITAEGQITGPSSPDDLASTLNLEVPPTLLASGLRYHVSLLETPSCTAPTGTVEQPRFPATGTQALGPVTSLGTLRVVLVPVSYAPDGSNRLPDTGAEQLARFRNFMLGRFPLANLDITVRAPITTNQPLTANGGGWSALVDSVAALRQADAAPADTYYYGMVRPTERFNQFCAPSCIVGLAVDIPPATDEYARAAIGLGFSEELLAETFVHEIGHVLGRRHTPCGNPAGPDPAFPYAGGLTGSWGYDLVTRELKPPQTSDFMGYCDPTWVSDYTYTALVERFRAVTTPARAGLVEVEPKVWRSIIVDVDSSLSWGHRVERRSEPSGTSVAATLLDASGASLGPVEARFAAMTHTEGGIIFMEEPTVEAAAVSIEGFGVLAF